ncbi:expressed unknown protein [Seminavis robusta]|uniref:Uncharacterized protein n=1 Tax=Seminavis robusta TaxID=568900 RepID=A0A9N8EU78_9STRA|nr:expressed unknown protein [Seminavis robusta]|eukprot:Sro1638_g287780.1 n/a (142) ;mRNA; r:15460-15885
MSLAMYNSNTLANSRADPPGDYARSMSVRSLGSEASADTDQTSKDDFEGAPGLYKRSVSTKKIGVSIRHIDVPNEEIAQIAEKECDTPGLYKRSKSTKWTAASTRNIDISKAEVLTSVNDEAEPIARKHGQPTVRFTLESN